MQDVAACGAHEPPRGGEDAQPEPFRFIERGGGREREPRGEGEELSGQRGDRQPVSAFK